MRRWLRDLGFPLLVLAALAASSYLAASVQVPKSIPDFALKAAPMYRLEIGGGCFAVLYLAAMAFVLALGGRGFAEIGTRGLRATELSGAIGERRAVSIEQRLECVEVELEAALASLHRLERQLARLKKKT
jgi:hypothetical protein